jgi:hypothetical protein
VPVPQARTRLVGDGWETSRPVAEKRDPVGHHPLFVPVPGAQEPVEQPPPPAPPGEPELRAQLATAIEAAANADSAARRAEAAHDRAEQHVNRCRQQVADFIGLDSELAEATAAALRDGADPALPDALASRLAARDRVRAELSAAEAATGTLLSERASAARAAGDAAKAVDTLTARLLSFAAERLAEEARALTAQAAQRRTALLGYDRLLANRLLPMPLSVRAVLGEVTGRDTLAADAGPWRRASDALRDDPQAAIEVELPPAVLPPLPQRTAWVGPPIVHEPIQRPEPPDDGDPYLVPAAQEIC